MAIVEQEYFLARHDNRDLELDNDGESEGECTDDGDSSAAYMDVMTELRELDKEETENVQQLNATTCGCSKRNGSPCSDYFTVQDLSELRMQMSELESEQLDLVVLSQIHAHHYTRELVGHRCKDERERV